MRPGNLLTAVLRVAVCLLAFAVSACASGAVGTHPPVRHSVTADGHPLTIWGRETPHSKGTVLLLHGRTWSALPDFDLLVDGDSGRSVMRALNGHGYSVYALDMRGYGSTPRDASGWLTPNRAAADVSVVLEWIAKRDAERNRKAATPRPALLGWSMGSLVAQLSAQRRPELISDLILFGYPRDPAKPTPRTQVPEAPPRELNTRERAISDFISPAVISQAVIDAYAKAALASDPVRADWRDLEQFNELDPARVRVPTLLLHGERDPLTPLDAQARVFTALAHPDRQWVILPGGDHAALIEDTSPAFVAAIVAFIERPRLRTQ